MTVFVAWNLLVRHFVSSYKLLVLPAKSTVSSVPAMCFIWVHSPDFAALSQVICFSTDCCIVEHGRWYGTRKCPARPGPARFVLLLHCGVFVMFCCGSVGFLRCWLCWIVSLATHQWAAVLADCLHLIGVFIVMWLCYHLPVSHRRPNDEHQSTSILCN